MEAQIHEVYTAVARFLHGHFVAMEAATAWRSINDPMQRQIISFLEIEKESEIEADVESLMSIIKKYKDNWDNERFVSGNHNQVLTYQNRARKNMLGYQKKIVESIGKKQHIVTQAMLSGSAGCIALQWKRAALSPLPLW